MTENRSVVARYIDGFRRSNNEQILSCLSDDVEWSIPGVFETRGKTAFAKHIVADGFLPEPDIVVKRWIEDRDTVVAEGSVRTQRTDGSFLNLAFCDIFEIENGKIRRLVSYLMELNKPAA
jgi:ketosteroid isomerase-like protein